MRRSDPRPATRLTGLVLAAAILTAACHAGGSRGPSPFPSATPRPFTVMSTDRITVTDPAAITDAASTVVSLNVFQRLMTGDPGQDAPKPDAARDCRFIGPTRYECVLQPDLRFSNGHPLTSSDVKFSIERAIRLNVPNSSAPLFSSLRKIDASDPQTVEFQLSRSDSQFVWALASPAGSILDEETYPPDAIQAPDQPIVGSGPFTVAHRDADAVLLNRYRDYVGRNPPQIDEIEYRTAPDSATIEDAMAKHMVDVVWRGLNAAAVTRMSDQVKNSPNQTTADGFTEHAFSGLRVIMLAWNPASKTRAAKAVRPAIATALQGDRTLDSALPGGVFGHIPTFPLGGRATPKITWKNRIRLTLSYDSTAPNALDVATQVRTRLEDAGGLSVRLVPDDAGADLRLLDRKAWTATPLAWLQPYLSSPLPSSATTLDIAVNEFRKATDDATAASQLAVIQKQAAADCTVVPLSQSDEYLFVRTGAAVSTSSFGPGWQLGLFGMKHG